MKPAACKKTILTLTALFFLSAAGPCSATSIRSIKSDARITEQDGINAYGLSGPTIVPRTLRREEARLLERMRRKDTASKKRQTISVIRLDKHYSSIRNAMEEIGKLMDGNGKSGTACSINNSLHRETPLFPTIAPASVPFTLTEHLEEDIALLCDNSLEGRSNCTAGAADASFFILRRIISHGISTRSQSFCDYNAAGHNIIGIIEGRLRSSGAIVILAHYDGMTVPGAFYPGADSNASGTAALLALAGSFGSRPLDKTLVLVATDAHYNALGGARALKEALEGKGITDIRLVINLDTIGSSLAPISSERRDYLIALGGNRWRSLLQLCNDDKLQLSYDYYGSQAFTRMFYNEISDHRPFLEKGIPCIMFTSGITMNTNKSTDTPDAIDYEILEKRIGLIRRFLENY